jgi:membrane-bound lytic murein transglycosylase B
VSADAKFSAFVRDFRAEAIRAGIRPETYDASMAGIRRNPRVEELNGKQPEFIKPVWQYLDTAVSPTRVANGRDMLERYGSTLTALQTRYGVPKEILVAVWGIESGYGGEMGSFNLFEALATLAYDGPRQAFARRELIAAMRMEEQQHLNPRMMTSSWAGAFGQTQFVPSSFLAHAVDGDGDGRIDLWRSPADALASAAVLLQRAGWQPGQPCYFEVRLPAGFPYESADANNMKPLADWRSLGVKTARGGDLPEGGAGAIYLPAGWRGPAFLVFLNFKAVLTYNNADSYALAVCNLADRLRGGGQILTSWPLNERPLGPSERIALQTALRALGYDAGDIDGVLGRKVRAALRRYQKDHGLPADGFPTQEMLARLNADLRSHAT